MDKQRLKRYRDLLEGELFALDCIVNEDSIKDDDGEITVTHHSAWKKLAEVTNAIMHDAAQFSTVDPMIFKNVEIELQMAYGELKEARKPDYRKLMHAIEQALFWADRMIHSEEKQAGDTKPYWLRPRMPERLAKIAQALTKHRTIGSDELEGLVNFPPSRIYHDYPAKKWKDWIALYIRKDDRGVYSWITPEPSSKHTQQTIVKHSK